MGDSTTTTVQTRANTTPEPSSDDDRREHLAIERAFVLRGLRELVANTEGM